MVNPNHYFLTGKTKPTEPPTVFTRNLTPLFEKNADCIGWVYIKDTAVDYPVMHTPSEPQRYLRLNFDKEYSTAGVPFLKGKCTMECDNLVIYGHNIRTGVGLTKITNYYPDRYGSLDFYLTHPTFEYESIYGGESTYVVFAGMYVNTQTQHGSVFNYYKFRNFGSEDTFYQYMEAVFDRSVFYNPAINVAYDDEFITLSTCYYPMGMNVDTRFVVFARKLREGESAKIDVSEAYINKSPLYFDYYYTVNGGSWAGRKWDTTKVKGFDEYLAENPDSLAAVPTV